MQCLICFRQRHYQAFNYLFPSIEVHACQLSSVRFSNEHIERLALINECSSVSCHVYESPLGNFPNCLVQWLEIIWDLINVLKDD